MLCFCCVIRYEHTGWRLPLYIWSVHPGSWQKGKTTQPVGCCLLPERAKPADINAQLENLAGQLTLPGIQQICLNPEFTFLLDLKRLLSVSAEKICASVSTLLNKYHSLSLAGLLFSPSSPDGAHRVKHHWGKDERWDVLLNSLVTLPAGLKAHKTGFSWIKALVAAAATLMLLWGAMMAISFIRGCAATAGTPLSRFLAVLPALLLPGRTAEGMASLVTLLAPDTHATVYHHDRRRVPLAQRVTMNTRQPVSLKHRPVMGNYGTDVNGQVLLRLTTTNPDYVRGWLPGGELHQDLMALLHVYLGSHLAVRLQLCVARHLLPNARLECSTSRAARLGQTAVMKLLETRQKRDDILTIHLGRWQCIRENIHRRESDEDGDYRW